MVSSKLTTRRATVKKPSICHPPPKFPPPPPPPTWPPEKFQLHFEIDYTWEGEPLHYEFDGELTRDDTTWDWTYASPPPPPQDGAAWLLSYTLHTASLHIRADRPPISIINRKYNIEVPWNEPTDYRIDDWDEIFPPDQAAVADFTF